MEEWKNKTKQNKKKQKKNKQTNKQTNTTNHVKKAAEVDNGKIEIAKSLQKWTTVTTPNMRHIIPLAKEELTPTSPRVGSRF